MTTHLAQECRIDAILTTLQINSQSAKDLFKEQQWTSSLSTLRARSEGWRRLNSRTEWQTHSIPALLENERILRELDPSTASESQTEDWSQILFTGSLSPVNFTPLILMYIAFSKIILAPMIAWSMPFMTLLLPFLALRFVYNMPITWDGYWRILQPMVFGQGPVTMTTVLQWGSMILSYAHGLYIPYTNAKHCYKIDQLMLKGSRALVDTMNRLREIGDTWVSYGLRKPWSFPDPSIYGDERQVLAWLVEDTRLLPQIYRAIGRVEITAAIQRESLVPVTWIESPTPHCLMIDAVDPLLSKDVQVPFTLAMGKKHHAICTGPNRGGKSTFLRSTLTNLFLAHTWGVAFARQCTLTPVEWLISSLRLEDRPGQESLFEREVSVAGEVLRRARAKAGRGWVVIDELFHTTNPPDAATASQLFLSQLWNSETVSSLVSTHLFSHATEAPDSIERLCVASEMKSDGKIEYTYKVVTGVNTMSSVNELLVEAAVSLDLKTSASDIEANAK